ncbi:MAG: class I SAM-dependent methyltransferase [Erythrobacter sp.]
MTIDPATFEFYQAQAPYFRATGAQGQSRHLDGFLNRLPASASILELGCGGGRDAVFMIKRGFQVDPTDGVPAMVDKANERYQVGARLMRFDQLDTVAQYQAIWAHACLLHCPTDALGEILSRIHRALQPGGLHFASYKLGDGEGRDLLGRLHNFPAADWLRGMYQDAQFEILEDVIYPGKGTDGTQRDWIALTVRKL